MKRMKKFLAVLLAAVMVMAMGSVSVFADGTVTLTVTGSTGGTITAAGSTTGAITSGSTSVTTGETVTLTVTPESGYVLSALTVTDGESNSVSVTGSGSTYTFTMPSTAVTVSATFVSGSYSIIITNEDATNGETYKAYKVFDLTYDANTGAYSYTIEKDSTFWNAILALSNLVTNDSSITHTDPTTAYFTLTQSASDDDVYVVTVLDAANNNGSLASAVVEALANVTLPATADGSGTLSSGTATITLTDTGYYFVTTTTGSAVILNSTAPTVLLADKNTAPSVEKTVSDTDGSGYGEANTAGIGDTVYYKAVISNINDASNIVFHDAMSQGLTFGSVTSVVYSADGTAVTETLDVNDDYTVTTTGLTDGCTFEIGFSTYLSNLSTLTDNSTLTIYYTATVNSNAVIGGTGNSNDAQISYGNYSKSTMKTTNTYVYELNVFKYTVPDTTETALSGATFVLYKEVSGTKYYAVISSGKLTGWTQYLSTSDSGYTSGAVATELTSDSNGMICIDGLDAGTYYLLETEAPSGYNKLTSAIKVTISVGTGNAESLSYKYGNDTSNGATVGSYSNVVKVENNTGSTIPVTGGMGTTILYIIGAILVIGAAVILVTRRRMANK